MCVMKDWDDRYLVAEIVHFFRGQRARSVIEVQSSTDDVELGVDVGPVERSELILQLCRRDLPSSDLLPLSPRERGEGSGVRGRVGQQKSHSIQHSSPLKREC